MVIPQKNIEVPLVLAFTPNYIVPASVCILSILDHGEETDYFHIICLLTEPLQDYIQQQLYILGGDRTRYSFINLQGKLQDIYIDEKYTIAASYRLLLPELLPDYDKVMYIDCDIIVRNNLAKLFREVNLDNNYLAGVYEAILDFQVSYVKALGCNPETYINSGFLIMNLRQMREDNMVYKFMVASKVKYLEFPDQDVLNQLCQGRIVKLPPFYNGIRTFYLPQYKASFLKYYNEEDWQMIQKQGTIHYTGGKPWDTFTVKFDLWWVYYEALPQSIKDLGKVNKKMYFLYKIYVNRVGRFMINGLQAIYRKIK